MIIENATIDISIDKNVKSIINSFEFSFQPLG